MRRIMKLTSNFGMRMYEGYWYYEPSSGTEETKDDGERQTEW